MSDDLDLPTNEEVFQANDVPLPVVPVEVQGIVRVDTLPGECAFRTEILLTGAPAVKIANADPRRQQIILGFSNLAAAVDAVCISNSMSDANAFRGAMLLSAFEGNYPFPCRDELYARGVNILSTTGTWQGFEASGDDVVLSIVEIMWAR